MTATAARGSTCPSPIASSFGIRTSFLLLLIFFLCVSKVKALAANEEVTETSRSARPSTLLTYDFNVLSGPIANRTQVTVATPSRNASNFLPTDFGSVVVYATVLREDEAGQTPVIGSINGLGTYLNDRSTFLIYTAVIATARYSGTISVQGHLDDSLHGELAITGGTGDFR